MTPIGRKAALIAALIGLLAIMICVTLYFTRKEILAISSRKDEFGTAVSYKIEQYRFRDRGLFTFRVGNDDSLTIDLSNINIEKIVEQQWLSNGRAIHLDLLIKPDGSSAASPARLIYDFQRGELYLSSPINLWRPALSGNRWMNNDEFNGVLARYTQ